MKPTTAGIEFILRQEIRTLTKMNESKSKDLARLHQINEQLRDENMRLRETINEEAEWAVAGKIKDIIK